MMRYILAVVGAVLLSGVVMGATVPVLPASFRQPWYAWSIVGVFVVAALYLVSRAGKTPRG